MKKKTKKIISLILSAALAVSSLTFVSYADDTDVDAAVETVLDETASDSALEVEEIDEAALVSASETEEIVEADLDPYYSEVPFSYTDDFSKLNQEYNMTQYIDLANADDVNGNSTTKVQLTNKAVYATLEDAVSGTGTATFTADVYSDDVDGDYAGRAFRIYLENKQTETTDGVGNAAFESTNIFYHLTDLGSAVYVVTSDDPTTNATTIGTMSKLADFETGTWYRFVIDVDFDNNQTTTYMYKHSSDGSYNSGDTSTMTEVGSLTADTVTGKTVSLKQMRLVRTAKTTVYFDNVSLAYDDGTVEETSAETTTIEETSTETTTAEETTVEETSSETTTVGSGDSGDAETTTEGSSDDEETDGSLRGDIDQNGEITANDAACLLVYVLNNENVNPAWDVSAEIADVAGDAAINAADVAAILSKALDSTYEFKDPSSSGSEESTEVTTEAVEETTITSSGGSSSGDEETTTETETETTTETTEVVGTSFLWWFDEVNAGGTVTPGTYSAGEDTADITVVPGLAGESYSAYSSAALEYSDGTTHYGYWASNRPDGAGNLTTLPTSGSSYYIKLNAAGTVTIYNYVPSGKNFFVKDFDESLTLVNTTTTGSMDSNGNDSLTFAGEAGHTYLVTTGGTNGLRFYGFKFLVDEPTEVPVNVTVGEGVDFSKATISFTDVDTEAVYATVVDGQTSVTLNAGHTYEISIDDGGIAVDYNGVTEFTFTGSETSIDLTLTNVPDATLTGTITSADSDNASSVVTSITFTKMSDETVSYTTTDIDTATGTYTAVLKPGEYNTSVETTDGSITNDRVSVAADTENVNEIYLEFEDTSFLTMYDEIQKSSSVVTFDGFKAHSAQYGVSGGVGSKITVPASAGQTLNIVMSYDGEFNVYDNGTGEVVNTGTSLKATYEVSDTATAVTIEVAATGNVVSGSGSGYVVSVEYIEAATAFKSALSVPGDYDTLNDAIAAIKSMDRPEGEDGRVTITLTSDLQEQVYMDADYVTLDGQGQYEVTWYYGVGSAYYSVDSSGLYSESLFRDAYSTRDASGSLWGGVMLVYGDYFLAHDVTFRNTYNYEVTDKEIADGVTPTDGKKERTKSTDVTVSSMRERSNALYTYGNYCEYKNCNILSSQDTLGINGTLYNYTYFKDCVIGGNCDYICGAGTMLFDNCTLQWKTEGASSLGYITAPKVNPYIFRNCTITQDGSNYVADSTGFYGRPWDAAAYAIYYQCETNDLIRYDGWYDMSSNSADNAYFYEYNNLATDGSVFMSTRGKDLNDEAYADILAAVEGDAVIDGMLGGWVPVYYEKSSASEETTVESGSEETTEAAAEETTASGGSSSGDEETTAEETTVEETTSEATTEDQGGSSSVSYTYTVGTATSYTAVEVLYTDSNVTISAVEALTGKDVSGDGTSYAIYGSGSDASKVTSSSGNTVRRVLEIVVANDNTDITVIADVNIDKTVEFLDSSYTTLASYANDGADKAEKYELSVTGLAAGTYYFGGVGTNVYVYGVNVEAAGGGSSSGSEETTEAATEETTAEETTAEETTAEETTAEETTAEETTAEETTEALAIASEPTNNTSGTQAADDTGFVTYSYDDTSATYTITDTSTSLTGNSTFAITGANSGTLKISGTVTPSTTNGNWTLVQIMGYTEGAESESNVFGIRTVKNNSDNTVTYQLRVGSDVVGDTGVAIAANTTVSYVFTYDFETGAVTLSVDGSDAASGTVALDSITGVKFVTASGSRNVSFTVPKLNADD
ncbi:MAG: pectinesterase family protein [Clostridiales bacterium]|nr:pectinesterase family protein [Clostridiales bacterium]